jgi:hypothetical protein
MTVISKAALCLGLWLAGWGVGHPPQVAATVAAESSDPASSSALPPGRIPPGSVDYEKLMRQADEIKRRADAIQRQLHPGASSDPFADFHDRTDQMKELQSHDQRPESTGRNYWVSALTIGVKLCLLCYFLRMAVTSWRRQRVARAAKAKAPGPG